MKFLRYGFSAAVALLVAAIPAVAAPIGTLAVTACTGQGVTVTTSLIDWLPAGGGSGCIDTVAPTNVTYVGGGPLLPGATGTIQDLPFGGGTVTDFMTFVGHPNLHFDLTGLGPVPPVTNTACPNTFSETDPVCVIVSGSPFVLRPGTGGTTVTLPVRGIGRDASATTSTYTGTFSVDFSAETPFQLQQRFLQTGSITSNHSGRITLTESVIPEPATAALVGTGLLFAGLIGRRRIRS